MPNSDIFAIFNHCKHTLLQLYRAHQPSQLCGLQSHLVCGQKKLRITSKCITIKQERSCNTYIIEHCAVIRRLKFLLFQWWTLQYLLTVLFVFTIGTLQLQK